MTGARFVQGIRSRAPQLVAAGIAVALSAGCILVSGQFVVDFEIGTVVVASPTNLVAVPIDLNTIDDYADHKEDLKGVSDLALLGVFRNNGSEAVAVEVYMTPDVTTYTDETTVRAAGIRLWGPFSLAAGQEKRITWDESASLFDDAGRNVLIEQIKGDGSFTIYAIGQSGSYSFTITEGVFVCVLDAGT
jgi:hypothetical protein